MVRLSALLPMLVFALCAGVGANAWAQEAGLVKTSRGKVLIERDGQSVASTPGAKLMASDRVSTGPDGSVGIALKDNTLLTVGPNTLMTLDRFAFDSTTHQGALEASIKRGTLAVVTGKIAKASPEAVQFRTPHSVLGVRGTEFIIEAGVEP